MTFRRQERGRLGRMYPLQRVIDFGCVSDLFDNRGVTEGAAFFEVCLFGHGEDVLDCGPAPRADSNYESTLFTGFTDYCRLRYFGFVAAAAGKKVAERCANDGEAAWAATDNALGTGPNRLGDVGCGLAKYGTAIPLSHSSKS